MNNKFDSVEIIKLLDQLIGSVEAVGESHTDRYINDNLDVMIDVGEWILDRIEISSRTAGRPEASMNEIGTKAKNTLMYWRDFLERSIEV